MKINENAEKFIQNKWKPCKIYSKSMKIMQNLVKINENHEKLLKIIVNHAKLIQNQWKSCKI